MLPVLSGRKRDLRHFFDDFDSAFGNFLTPSESTSVNYPRVDIHEDEDNYYIDADLPGIEKKDIAINIDNNVLTVSGSREDKREEKKKGYYRLERQTGRFERSFQLGEHVDVTGAEAEFDKGVLNIVIPKREESKPKQLDIKTK